MDVLETTATRLKKALKIRDLTQADLARFSYGFPLYPISPHCMALTDCYYKRKKPVELGNTWLYGIFV